MRTKRFALLGMLLLLAGAVNAQIVQQIIVNSGVQGSNLPTSCSQVADASQGSTSTGSVTLTSGSMTLTAGTPLIVTEIVGNGNGITSVTESRPTDTFPSHNTYRADSGGSGAHFAYNSAVNGGTFFYYEFVPSVTGGTGTVTMNFTQTAPGGYSRMTVFSCNGTLTGGYDTNNVATGSTANHAISVTNSHSPDFEFTGMFQNGGSTAPTGYTGMTLLSSPELDTDGYGNSSSGSFTATPTGGGSGQFDQWIISLY